MPLHWHIQIQHIKDGQVTQRRAYRRIFPSLHSAESDAVRCAGIYGKHGTRRYEIHECRREPCSADLMAETRR